jgi:hypothetical protein
MNSRPADITSVERSVRVYQWLLNAYPTQFREEYGQHMLQVFRDCCLRTVCQGGQKGLVRLWVFTLLDFIRSVLEQHLQKETDMSKSTFVKLSGWAFIVGSFAFITILSGSFAGSLIGSILIAVGMLGLRARYGEIVGSFGRNILLIGVAGMVLTYVSLSVLWEVEAMYLLPFAGPAVLLAGLTLFGLVALVRKPLPHVNWLPLIAGIWYPVIFFPIFFYALTNNGAWPENDLPWVPIQSMLSLQFLALCILGVILQSDAPEEVHALA